MTQFEKGALFAMQVLKEVLAKHDRAIGAAERAAGEAGSRDLYAVLNGVRNVTHGLRAEFESQLLPGLRGAQETPSAEIRDQLRQVLLGIQAQATRKERASAVKHLLEGDLEIITARVQEALRLEDQL